MRIPSDYISKHVTPNKHIPNNHTLTQYRTFIGSLYAAGDGVGSNVGVSDIGILVGGIS